MDCVFNVRYQMCLDNNETFTNCTWRLLLPLYGEGQVYLRDCRIRIIGGARVGVHCTPRGPIQSLVRSGKSCFSLNSLVPVLWSPKPSFPLEGTEESPGEKAGGCRVLAPGGQDRWVWRCSLWAEALRPAQSRDGGRVHEGNRCGSLQCAVCQWA